MFKYFLSLALLALSVMNVAEAAPDSSRPPYMPPQRNYQNAYAYRDLNDETDLQRRSRVTNNANWDFQQGWRNDSDAYFRGETQPQVYRENHPYGRGGVGYEPDYNYYNNLADRSNPRWNDRGYPTTLNYRDSDDYGDRRFNSDSYRNGSDRNNSYSYDRDNDRYSSRDSSRNDISRNNRNDRRSTK